jgi:hypothetical protein
MSDCLWSSIFLKIGEYVVWLVLSSKKSMKKFSAFELFFFYLRRGLSCGQRNLQKSIIFLSWYFFQFLQIYSNILVLRGAYCFFNQFDEFVQVAREQKFDFLCFWSIKNSKTTWNQIKLIFIRWLRPFFVF